MVQSCAFLIPLFFLITIALSETKSLENHWGNGDLGGCVREKGTHLNVKASHVCLTTQCVNQYSGMPAKQANCKIYRSPCGGFPFYNVIFWKCCNDSWPIMPKERTNTQVQTTVKMVGGTPAEFGQFPYQVSLRFRDLSYDRASYYGDEQFCGGSIYSKLYVITAAHCVTRVLHPENIFVVAGDQKVTAVDKIEQKVGVEKIVIHPSFKSNPYENDIALIKLKEPFVLTEFVQPISLPPAYHQAKGSATVSGWGLTQPNIHANASKLTYSTVDIISDQSCQAVLKSVFSGTVLCASNMCHSGDACQGDSGGPMVCNDLGSPYLCGVVSFREGCANQGYIGIYTEVSHFTYWIEENAK